MKDVSTFVLIMLSMLSGLAGLGLVVLGIMLNLFSGITIG